MSSAGGSFVVTAGTGGGPGDSSACLTDTFTRTVADGPDQLADYSVSPYQGHAAVGGWGVSDAGLVWVHDTIGYGGNPDDFALSTDGHHGVMSWSTTNWSNDYVWQKLPLTGSIPVGDSGMTPITDITGSIHVAGSTTLDPSIVGLEIWMGFNHGDYEGPNYLVDYSDSMLNYRLWDHQFTASFRNPTSGYWVWSAGVDVGAHDLTAGFTMKMRSTATAVYGKIWWDGEDEPDWMQSVPGVGTGNAYIQFYLGADDVFNSGGPGSYTLLFDDLDIKWAGMGAIYPSGSAPTGGFPGCPETETFSRTVPLTYQYTSAAVWGASEIGNKAAYLWNQDYDWAGGVDGNSAIIHHDGDSTDLSANDTNSTGAMYFIGASEWDYGPHMVDEVIQGSFVIEARFRFDIVPDGTDQVLGDFFNKHFDFGFDTDYSGLGYPGDNIWTIVHAFIRVSSDPTYGGIFLVDRNGYLPSNNHTTKTDWEADTWYRMKFQKVSSPSTARFKVWKDSDPEPGWDFDLPTTSTPPPYAGDYGLEIAQYDFDNMLAFVASDNRRTWDTRSGIYGSGPGPIPLNIEIDWYILSGNGTSPEEPAAVGGSSPIVFGGSAHPL
jgi:hypothetical protein